MIYLNFSRLYARSIAFGISFFVFSCQTISHHVDEKNKRKATDELSSSSSKKPRIEEAIGDNPVTCTVCDNEVIKSQMLTLNQSSMDDVPTLVNTWMAAIQAIEDKIDTPCWNSHIKPKLSIMLAEKLTEVTQGTPPKIDLYPLLHYAIVKGYAKIVEICMGIATVDPNHFYSGFYPESQKYDVPDTDPDKDSYYTDPSTALHLAIFHGSGMVVDALLSHPAIDVNLSNKDHNSPLHMAVYDQDEYIVRRLLDHPDIKHNKNLLGNYPIHIQGMQEAQEAQEFGKDTRFNWNILEAFFTAHTSGIIDCNVTDIFGNTLLHLAVKNGHHELVRLMFRSGYIEQQIALTNELGETPLAMALRICNDTNHSNSFNSDSDSDDPYMENVDMIKELLDEISLNNTPTAERQEEITRYKLKKRTKSFLKEMQELVYKLAGGTSDEAIIAHIQLCFPELFNIPDDAIKMVLKDMRSQLCQEDGNSASKKHANMKLYRAVAMYQYMQELLSSKDFINNKDSKIIIKKLIDNFLVKFPELIQYALGFAISEHNTTVVFRFLYLLQQAKSLERVFDEEYLSVETTFNADYTVLKTMLDLGLKVDKVDYRKRTLLHYCLSSNNHEKLDVILGHVCEDKQHGKANMDKLMNQADSYGITPRSFLANPDRVDCQRVVDKWLTSLNAETPDMRSR